MIRGEEAFETEARVIYRSPWLGLGVRFQEDGKDKRLTIWDRWLGRSRPKRVSRPTRA
jgi:hypothetical protein